MTPLNNPRKITARRNFFALALAALAAPALAHPPAILSPQGEAGMVEEIEGFYRTLSAAVTAKDVVKLRTLYDDRFSHTHTSARTDGKDARIVSLLAGEATVELLPFRERRITLHAGGWAAVVRGLTPIRANDGKTYLVHWTQTLARRGDDAWQLIASHATRGAEVVG
jgi:hypothetical protein